MIAALAESSFDMERNSDFEFRLSVLSFSLERDRSTRMNGQPRRIKVPDRSRADSAAIRAKAEPGNAAHLGAPMPGVVSTLAVSAGQSVRAGDVLLSIEAMKMETALHSERDGTVQAVNVKAGDQIDAKDLLIVFAA